MCRTQGIPLVYMVRTKRMLETKDGSKLKDLQVWPAVIGRMGEGAGQEATVLDVGSLTARTDLPEMKILL